MQGLCRFLLHKVTAMQDLDETTDDETTDVLRLEAGFPLNFFLSKLICLICSFIAFIRWDFINILKYNKLHYQSRHLV